jgi:hypothetical protein
LEFSKEVGKMGSSFSAFPDESTDNTSSARLDITFRYVKNNEEGEDFLKLITLTATAFGVVVVLS